MKVESRRNYIKKAAFPTTACLHKKMSEEWAGQEAKIQSVGNVW